MKIIRRKARVVKIGRLCIGGKFPVAIQSMAKSKTSEIEQTLAQIDDLGKRGCEIVRLAVKDNQDALAIKSIRSRTHMPLVADIHFNWRLALVAIENGIDKIRLNPGNIYKKEEVQEIARQAKRAHIPIRVGVNSGSLKKSASSQAKRMVESALDYIKILEKVKFYDIVVSLKASNILETIEAYQLIARRCDYPLHLGLTATGLPFSGAIKSSIALGVLLLEGLGDTLRISLTDRAQEEIRVARGILEALGLRHFGPEIISCPTCGRCEVDLVSIVKELESSLSRCFVDSLSRRTRKRDNEKTRKPFKVAVMGCVVNGPGEAAEADLGIAFGAKAGLLFKHGKPLKKVSRHDCVKVLLEELRRAHV